MPAASASSPGDHLRRRPTWACRWSASGSSTPTATSSSASTRAGQHERYTQRTGADLGAELSRDATVRRASVSRRASGAARCTSSIWRLMVGSRNAPAAGREHRRQRTRRARDHRPPLRRRSRDAHPPGAHFGHRWPARAAPPSGFNPTAFHINEGHSVFLQLERLRLLIEAGGHSLTWRWRSSGATRRLRPTRPCRPATKCSPTSWRPSI